MSLLLYAALSIIAVNLFAAVVYTCLHRGAGLAISLAGTILVCIGLTYATLNDVPAAKPAPDVTTTITTPSPTPDQPHTVHPSLDPSSVSRETPAATPTKRPVYTDATPHAHRSELKKTAPVRRSHFDDREKELQKEQRGTEPGAGGCDDIAAGGCK